MLDKATKKRWRQEGILSPSSFVDRKWRCPVCGADKADLKFTSNKTPEAVACFICDLPFSLSQNRRTGSDPPRPLPAVSDDWVTAWGLAFRDKGFKKTCCAVGNQKLTQILTIFSSAQDAITFLELSKTEASP